ncbi:MAG TPA: tetratricopeptide repeat protein [Longimicrobiaceae bacterium]
MSEDLPTDRLIARGREAYARADYAVAVADLREVVGRQPRFADIHQLLGVCLALVGRPLEALESFDRALEINPRYVEALINRAITLHELGRYQDARASFEAAAEADLEEGVGRFPSVLATRLAHAHAQLAELYQEGGARAEAAEQLRRAVDLRPRFADIRNRLAAAYIDLGDPYAAIRELEQILAVNPNFLAARINLGLAWYRSGDREAARREWEKCLTQRPDDPHVTAYLRMVGDAETRPAGAG